MHSEGQGEGQGEGQSSGMEVSALLALTFYIMSNPFESLQTLYNSRCSDTHPLAAWESTATLAGLLGLTQTDDDYPGYLFTNLEKPTLRGKQMKAGTIGALIHCLQHIKHINGDANVTA